MDIQAQPHCETLLWLHNNIAPHAKTFSNTSTLPYKKCHSQLFFTPFSLHFSLFIHILIAQDCLSPHLDIILERPLAELVSRTNTSITVNWTAPILQSSCTNVFFPPLMYMVRVRLVMEVVDGFPQVSTTYMYIALL